MKEAVIVLGHGSRREEANDEVREMAKLLGESIREIPCKAAFLSFGSPDLEAITEELFREGVKRVYVAPFFLVTGNHIKEDIPREISRQQERHPEMDFNLISHLGPHPQLAGLISEKIKEARNTA